jgi:hypothetical protein
MKLPSISILFCLFAQGVSGDAAAAAKYFGAEAINAASNEYTTWLEKNASQPYKRHVFLPARNDTTHGMAVHWTIQDGEIQLAVAAKTTGWLGFGT